MGKNRRSDDVIKSLFVSLAPTQALITVLPSISALISTCITGKFIGQNALAAMGFAGPFNSIVMGFAALIGIGAQLTCSKEIGECDEKGINKVFSTAVAFCFVIGSLLGVLSFLIPQKIALFLGASGELLEMTAEYIKGYSLCCFCSIFITTMLQFLQIDSAKEITTICIVVQIALNLILNVINITVWNLGVFGVGISASCAAAVSLLIGICHFIFKTELFRFSFSDVSFKYVKKISAMGVNSGANNLWVFARERVLNQIAFSLGGAVVISALAVANNIGNTIGCALQAATEGSCNIIAGVLYGEKDVKSLRELPKVSVKTIMPYSVVFYTLTFIFAKPFASLFGADSSNLAYYATVIRLFNLWWLTNPLKTTGLAVYTATGRIKETGIFSFLSICVFPIALLLIAKIFNSLTLVFLMATLSEVFFIASFVLYFIYKNKKYKPSLSEFVYVPRTFSVPKEDTLNLTVQTVQDATEASQKAIEFCKSKGFSDKNSMYCGLCIEELTVDTVLHGINKKNRRNSIDIRLLNENGKLTILLRDNCTFFNPGQWLKTYAKDDSSRSIGLKMVFELAEDINYSNNLGLNIITFRLHN